VAAHDPIGNSASSPDAGQTNPLSRDGLIEVLWESAVESFFRAILVIVFGTIALGLASGIWDQMAPSRPPGFDPKPQLEAPAPGSPRATWIGEHHFVIVFGVIFTLTVWLRLTRSEARTDQAGALSHLRKMGQHLSENWFGLILRNALGAILSAFVVVWVQQFTLANMIFHWLLGAVLAQLQSLVQHILGGGGANTFQAWLNWYDDNQLKFMFWFFYLSAICDDLGIPNFKTLGLRLVRSLRHRWRGIQEPST